MENACRIAELIERDAWLDLFQAAPGNVRTELGMSCDTIAGIGLLGCRAIPITELNRAMAIGVETRPSSDDVENAIGWLDEHATSWALQFAPDVSVPEVRALTVDAGLAETGSGWAKFVGTEGMISARSEDGPVEVVVVDLANAPVFSAVVTEGFGLPPVCAEWFTALAGRPSWQCFLAMVDGQAAGGGAMFAWDGAAWLGIEATASRLRRRGAQRGIISAQIAAASGAGVTTLTCETARPADRGDLGFSSYRNQERAGLTHAYTRRNFKRAG